MAQAQKIILDPHPSLHKESKAVKEINDPIKDLIATMRATVESWERDQTHYSSVGLAAVQINELYRVVMVRGSNNKFYFLINPEILKYEGLPVVDDESCMSVHGIHGRVPRYPKVKVRALDEFGDEIKFTAKGYEARIIQHEVDHTNGLLFLDRALREDKGGSFKFFDELSGDYKLLTEDELIKKDLLHKVSS